MVPPLGGPIPLVPVEMYLPVGWPDGVGDLNLHLGRFEPHLGE